MDIELTEEEQKIYDNLVKYSSGEYRDTELDIIESSGVKNIEVIAWMSSRGKTKVVNGEQCLLVKNWRELLELDLYLEFIKEFRYGHFKSVLSMGKFVRWKKKKTKIINREDLFIQDNIDKKDSRFDQMVYFIGMLLNWVEYDTSRFALGFLDDNVNSRDWKFLEKVQDPTVYLYMVNLGGTVKIYLDNVSRRFVKRVDFYRGSCLSMAGIPEVSIDIKGDILLLEDIDKFIFENSVLEFSTKIVALNVELSSLKKGAGIEVRFGDKARKNERYKTLLNMYVGMLKYGSPENYLKQVIASRKAV
jgi:hypothetical protein